MLKKLLLLLFVIMIATGSVGAAADYPVKMPEENVLVESFENCRAEVIESTINCWGKMNNRFMDMREIQLQMDAYIEKLGYQRAVLQRTAETDEQFNKETAYVSEGNKTYCIAIESVNKGLAAESYIIIDVTIDRSYHELEAEKKKLDGIFRETLGTLRYSRCIIGTYDGKLEDKEMGRKTRTALNAVKAKRVEGIENEEMSSISAFSSQLDDYILANEKKVNLQVALRYSAYDDKTYIWIGTPLIPIEY